MVLLFQEADNVSNVTLANILSCHLSDLNFPDRYFSMFLVSFAMAGISLVTTQSMVAISSTVHHLRKSQQEDSDTGMVILGKLILI